MMHPGIDWRGEYAGELRDEDGNLIYQDCPMKVSM